MNIPEQPQDGGDVDPFSDLGTDLEAFNSDEVVAIEPDTVLVANVVAASSVQPAIRGRRISPVAVALATIVLLLAGIAGWLGFGYWQDRELLATLTADLVTARDAFEATKSREMESGESARATQLVQRAHAITDGAWWERVVVQIVDQQPIADVQSQSLELETASQHRTANRAWWLEQTRGVETALAIETRTIEALEQALSQRQSAEAPHPSVGGFSDEMVVELNSKLERDIAELTASQIRTVESLTALHAAIKVAKDSSALAAFRTTLAQPLPIDRDPPALSDLVQVIEHDATEVEDLLATRDALHSELIATLRAIASTDLETMTIARMRSTRDELAQLSIPNDERFDEVRELASTATTESDVILGTLQSRDSSLEWIALRVAELDQVETLEDVAAFARELSDGDVPQSELPIVSAAFEDLQGRIGARVQQLEAERAALELSLARAAQCGRSLNEFAQLIEVGHVEGAATVLLAIEAETDLQHAQLNQLRAEFPKELLRALSEYCDAHQSAGEESMAADLFRRCYSNAEINTLSPSFRMESADWWHSVLFNEDRAVYQRLHALVLDDTHGGYSAIHDAATLYFDSQRTLGDAPAMHEQVTRLLEAIETPAVTLRIDGITWAGTVCNPPGQTAVNVRLRDSLFSFVLTDTTGGGRTVVEADVSLSDSHVGVVHVAITGSFQCATGPVAFSGAGDISMDELRRGGGFQLAFWDNGDPLEEPHHLLLTSVPQEELRNACNLPEWRDPRTPVQEIPTAPPQSPTDSPIGPGIEPIDQPVDRPAAGG